MNGAAVPAGALSVAGLVEMLPVLCSKNSGGNAAEGKRRGDPLGAGWGASPPSSSCQALCEEGP